MTAFLKRPFILMSLAFALLGAACAEGVPQDAEPRFVIGLVTNNPNGMRNVGGFIEGMADLGYVDGEDVSFLFAGRPLDSEELKAALDEMVAAEVDLIFTAGTPTGVAAYEATLGTDIPVVFGVIADPIRAGVMADLTRPRGNLTGVKTNADHGRRLELLREIAPDVERVLVPYNPDDAAAASAVDQISRLASGLGVELLLRQTMDDTDVLGVLATIPEGVDAIFLVPDSLVNAHLPAILETATALKLVTSGPSTAQVEEGALMAFGFVHHEAGVQAARIADHVLKGAAPGALPVEDTESFLAINLVTADAIGREISDAMLRQAAVVLRQPQSIAAEGVEQP